MKMNVALAVMLVGAMVLASGCPAPQGSPAGGAKWASKAAGSYKGGIFSGATEFPGTTKIQADKSGKLSGTYELKEADGTVVKGTLSDFRTVGDRKLECKWTDKNGTGDFEITFAADLASFKGQWNNADNDQKHAWNGKR